MKTMRHTIIGMFAFLMLMTVITFGSAGIKVKAACSHKATGKWQITKNATCDSNGTKVMKCKKCKCVLQTVKIGKLGHNWGAYQTTVAPTCTSAGTQISRCTRCVATRPATIPATGHNASGSYIVTKKATCTKKGTQVRKCTKCSVNLETKIIPVLGHKYGAFETTKKETCTTDGKRTRECKRSGCNKIHTEVIKKRGHNWGKYKETKEVTCTADGSKKRVCTACKATQTTKIAAKGHEWGAYKETRSVSCEANGYMSKACSKCKLSEVITVKALPYEVIRYKEAVRKYAKNYNISEYVNVLLAIMQQESKGKRKDVMQSSESAGLPRNTLDTQESMEQGCKYFSDLLTIGKGYNVDDLKVIIQSYNFGPDYIQYVIDNGKKEHSYKLAKGFAKREAQKKLDKGKIDKLEENYDDPIAKELNNGKRYAFGNMFYIQEISRILTIRLINQ